MRLDRLNLTHLAGRFRELLAEALAEPGCLACMILPTSPSDGVQIFVRARDGTIYLAIRRPAGKEHPRELEVLASCMGLTIVNGPYVAKGKQIRSGYLGQRTYLVAECALNQGAPAGPATLEESYGR
ncbi:MAG: hypothetical protein N2318_03275 [Meiothermus sp.]|nr:hypothetical protein [Meiothermus sp.]